MDSLTYKLQLKLKYTQETLMWIFLKEISSTKINQYGNESWHKLCIHHCSCSIHYPMFTWTYCQKQLVLLESLMQKQKP